MTIEHKNITEANLHELKGASTATAGQIPVATGSGSSTWTTVNNLNKMAITTYFPNLADADSVFITAPLAGTISKAYITVHNAIDADTVVTLKIGGVAVTNGTISVVASGSTGGSVFSCTPTAANAVIAGQAIEIVSNGAATANDPAYITLLLSV
jgi:hypothetical protein